MTVYIYIKWEDGGSGWPNAKIDEMIWSVIPNEDERNLSKYLPSWKRFGPDPYSPHLRNRIASLLKRNYGIENIDIWMDIRIFFLNVHPYKRKGFFSSRNKRVDKDQSAMTRTGTWDLGPVATDPVLTRIVSKSVSRLPTFSAS